MTVGELINILSEYDPNAKVVIDGYEGGVEDINTISSAKAYLNVNDDWWYGKHELVEHYWKGFLSKTKLKEEDVVYISR
jgi:hypothetical protein